MKPLLSFKQRIWGRKTLKKKHVSNGFCFCLNNDDYWWILLNYYLLNNISYKKEYKNGKAINYDFIYIYIYIYINFIYITI